MKKRGLGKGINAIFSDNTFFDLNEENVSSFTIEKEGIDKENINYIKELKLIDIVPNKEQARKVFDDDKLKELANSIKMFGVLQPIIVTKDGDYYTIVAGERRWRASKLAGVKTIPAIITEKNDKENAQVSIIENLQRENLNPVEKARGITLLLEKYNLTGSELSEITGISLSSILNSIKIMQLEDDLLDEMQKVNNLSEAACLALLETNDYNLRKEVFLLMTKHGLPAQEALKRLRLVKRVKKTNIPFPAEFKEAENSFSTYFGNKVKIKLNRTAVSKGQNKGEIIIKYNSSDDLARMLDLLK